MSVVPSSPPATRDRASFDPLSIDPRVVRIAAAAVGLLVCAIAASTYLGQDLDVYRATGRTLLEGQNPYTDGLIGTWLPCTYTPFSAILMVPMAYVSHGLGMFLITAASLLAYWWVLGKVVAAVWSDRDEDQRVVITAAVALVLLGSEPVSQTLGFGQINFFLMAAVIADVARSKPSRWQGVPIAIAATLKLIPGIFLVYLLVTRRVRGAITGGVAFLASIAVGWVAMPAGSRSYWLDGVGTDPTHIGGSNNLTNGSLLGLFARPLGYAAARPYWLVAAVPTFLLGLWVARELHRRFGDIAGITATAFTAMLVSPIAWTHHWTWFVVPALWVGRVAWERRDGRLGAAVAVWIAPFFVPPIRFVPFDHWTTATHTATESILGSAFVVWGLVGLVALAVWLRRTPATATERTSPLPATGP